MQAQVEAWAQAVNTPAGDFAVCQNYVPSRPLAHVDTYKYAIILGASQVNGLRDAVRRTSQLAHQLLALSRADAHSLDAQPLQRVDLKVLCETLLEEHLDAATAKRIDLGLDVQAVQVTARACPWLNGGACWRVFTGCLAAPAKAMGWA